MKKILVLLVLSAIVLSCKNQAKKENLPEELSKIIAKHGGVDTWKKAKVISFNRGKEVHTTDLQTRKAVINHPYYSLGFDGKEVWLHEEEKGSFESNPSFYYNLYFYFYAMPFVLTDDGIIYEKVDGISFEGVTYPGIKISYKANVGTSPDDNYILYYNPETYRMEWLAYTVTFTSKKPSDKYNILKYDEWENVNGLVLPKKIIWFGKDDKGNPTKQTRPSTVFTLPLVSQGKLADSFYAKPVK